MARRTTLQDIADQLGVSKYAVSRALAGKSGVSEDTRRTILRTAVELGYVARNNTAGESDHVNGSARTIHVIIRDKTVANRELWIDAISGIEMEAARSGLEVASIYTDEAAVVANLSRNALGLILVGPNTRDTFDAARLSGSPSVTVSHVVPPLYEMDQVTATDDEAGVYVGDFLAGLGHRHMVYVHGQTGFPGRDARLRGYRQAIDRMPDAQLREIAFGTDYNAAGFREAVLEMAETGFEPTAFFCGSDGVAVTLISEINRLGLKVPDQVSVVGHADYPIATHVSPNLTTVHMPHRQMGMKAVRMLKARAGVGAPPSTMPFQRVAFVPHLVIRQSSGPMRSIRWAEALKVSVSG